MFAGKPAGFPCGARSFIAGIVFLTFLFPGGSTARAQGYRETADPSVYVRFPLLDDDGQPTDTDLLVWTTTPWTLTSNVAAAVHPDLPYVLVEQDGRAPGSQMRRFWLSRGALDNAMRGRYTVVDEKPGAALEEARRVADLSPRPRSAPVPDDVR